MIGAVACSMLDATTSTCIHVHQKQIQLRVPHATYPPTLHTAYAVLEVAAMSLNDTVRPIRVLSLGEISVMNQCVRNQI